MELNSIIFPQLKTKISLEAFLNGKLAYIPKLKKISEDSQIPMSPRSSRPSEMMAKYPAQSVKATKNIAFEKSSDSASQSFSSCSSSQSSSSSSSCSSPSPYSQNILRQSTILTEVSSTSLRENKKKKEEEEKNKTEQKNKQQGEIAQTIDQQIQQAKGTSKLQNQREKDLSQKLREDVQSQKQKENVSVQSQSQSQKSALKSNISSSSFTQISTEEVSQYSEIWSNPNTPKNKKKQGECSVLGEKKCECNEISSSSAVFSSSAGKSNECTNSSGFIRNIFQFSFSAQKSTPITSSCKMNNQPESNSEMTMIMREQQKQRNSMFCTSYRSEQESSNSENKSMNNHKSCLKNQMKVTESQLYNPDFMGYDIDVYQPVGYVPVLYLSSNSQSDNLLIYFHANGEDIFSSYPLLNHLRQVLEINIIGVEYPGYGSYKTASNCTADLIQEDAQYVFDFLTKQLKFELKNIILLGRSIGTGPATYLASKHQVGALVLISAFTSIRGIVEDFAWFFKYMIKERFNNLDNIKNVTSPTFLLHGKKDSLISYKQSITLSKNCKSISEIKTPNEMNHGTFNYSDDLSIPLLNFLLKCNYPLGRKNVDRKPFPEGLTYHPSHIQML